MHHIVIDARNISHSNKYVENFLGQLQIVDKSNRYTILVRPDDKDFWKPTVTNFNIKTVDLNENLIKDQLKFKSLLNRLSPDLVHFCTIQPLNFYAGRRVVNLDNITIFTGSNHGRQTLLKYIQNRLFKNFLQLSSYIIVPNAVTKSGLLKIINVPADAVAVIPFEANVASEADQDLWRQIALQTHSVYIDAIRNHIKF